MSIAEKEALTDLLASVAALPADGIRRLGDIAQGMVMAAEIAAENADKEDEHNE